MSEPNAGDGIRPAYDYAAYGMKIRCDIPLPELVPDDFDEPDVEIGIGRVDGPDAPFAERIVELDGNTAYFAVGGLGKFLIRDRKSIAYEPIGGLDLSLLNLAILGPVMAILLHLKGLFILHGSALGLGGRASMFLGDKGAGKSTTASVMLAAGHAMLTDDVLAISFPAEGGPVVIPGYPQIKLSYEAAGIVDLPAHQLIPTNLENFDKHRVRFSGSFVDTATPAGAIYILKRGEQSRARRMDHGEALHALLRFSYTVRFGEAVLSGAAMGEHLRQAAMLANAVPVFELETCSVIERLDETVALVERQSRSL